MKTESVFIKMIVVCVCIPVYLCLFVSPVEGKDVLLPSDVLIGDTDGFYVDESGEYFIDLQNLMPGDAFTKEILIKNTNMQQGFSLYLSARPGEQHGSFAFQEAISISISQNNLSLYEGNMFQDSNLREQPLLLSTLKPGEECEIKVIFTVDHRLGLADYQEDSAFFFYWDFTAIANVEAKANEKSQAFPRLGGQENVYWQQIGWLSCLLYLGRKLKGMCNEKNEYLQN